MEGVFDAIVCMYVCMAGEVAYGVRIAPWEKETHWLAAAGNVVMFFPSLSCDATPDTTAA